jgi:hypothetical protein
LRYLSGSGGWQLDDVDLSEYLLKYRDCELTLIITATGEAEERIVCGICGFALDEVKECPRCRLINEDTARRIMELLVEQREAMFREVEEILRDDEGGGG